MTCPHCEQHTFPDGSEGKHVCPQCHTEILFVSGAFTPLPKRYRFRDVQKAPKRLRDTAVVFAKSDTAHQHGKVLCACCQMPFNPPGSACGDAVLDGYLDTDGRQLIRKRIGWTLVDNTFEPAYQERFIPKRIRGLICVECSMMGTFRQVGRMDVNTFPESTKSASSDVRAAKEFQNLPPTSCRTPDELEFAVSSEWAHTGESGWIKTDNTRYHVDDCCCWECARKACGQLESGRTVAAILIHAAHMVRFKAGRAPAARQTSPRRFAPLDRHPDAPVHGPVYTVNPLTGERSLL